MRALCYLGNGKIDWLDRPMPKIQHPKDVIVKIHKTTICGTDLHIIKGSVETATPGRILGHEGIGTVVEVGSQVTKLAPGARVLVSCITSCGQCDNCRKNFFGHCDNGGWRLGNTIDGCQAEYVRIPYGETSSHLMPDSVKPGPEEDGYLMLSDILPTGLEVGIMEGQVAKGKTLAVIGVGPVGLAAIFASHSYSPERVIAVDRDENRLEAARQLGATHLIHNGDETAIEQIMELTGGKGVEVAIEAIGTPRGWELCENIVAAGGNIAILGVHGKPVTLHLERMWKRNFTLTAGLVHTYSIPALMAQIQSQRIDPRVLISHRFTLDEMMHAYNVFSNPAEHKALKVLMEANR